MRPAETLLDVECRDSSQELESKPSRFASQAGRGGVTMDILEKAKKTTRAVAFARECIDRKDWRRAEKALVEAQHLIEHLMHEVSDKHREAMAAPKPEESDRE